MVDEVSRRAAGAYKKVQGLLKEVRTPDGNDEAGKPAPAHRDATSPGTDATTPGPVAADAKAEEVARFLALVGREEAASILKRIPRNEADRILDTMAHLQPISRREAIRALTRFGGAREVGTGETRVGPETAREILIRAYGPKLGDQRFYEILPDQRPSRFSFLEEADGGQLSMLLRKESTATVAIMCAHMPKSAAARLLAALPAETKPQVIRRMAQIDAVAPEVLDAIESTLRERLESIQRPGGEEIDGEARIAEILRYMDLTSSDRILHDLGESDADLEGEIRSRLNTPEDLLYVADRDVQRILQRVDDVDLATLIKGKRPELVERLLSNLSDRRREIVMMERESLGPMRRGDVDRVTADFMNLVREMAAAGEIVIRLPGEDQWVE